MNQPHLISVEADEPVSLDALVTDQTLVTALTPDTARALLIRILPLQVALLSVALAPRATVAAPGIPDPLLGVKEAAEALMTSEDWIYRHGVKLGLGYRDDDGRLKFPASRVARHVQQKLRATKAP